MQSGSDSRKSSEKEYFLSLALLSPLSSKASAVEVGKKEPREKPVLATF